MRKISVLLVVLWMGVIFYFSNQPASVSTNQSDNVINAINRIVEDNPILKNKIDKLYKSKGASFIIRKSAHMISYATLGILLFIMIYSYKSSILISLRGSFLISALYAITDEIHQYFIPGRACMIQDIIIDSIGAIIGILLISMIYTLAIAKISKLNNL